MKGTVGGKVGESEESGGGPVRSDPNGVVPEIIMPERDPDDPACNGAGPVTLPASLANPT